MRTVIKCPLGILYVKTELLETVLTNLCRIWPSGQFEVT